jgi:adenosylcobinamide kinase/adenosylcobinamide-phosphate guanylyltransferase
VITLVLGGARSGKSAVAESLAAELPSPVTYLATALVEDDDMAARVAEHQQRRPPGWVTVEAGLPRQLADRLAGVDGSVVVDSLGTWVAGWPEFEADVDTLCQVLLRRSGASVIVSEEVGLGIHPMTDSGRRFRDALGRVNQAVAAIADDVLLVVAGRTLRLDPIT